MDKNFIIGIPLRDFRDPMTRLSSNINLDERINLMKHMFLNIVKSFQETNVEIFSITKDSSVIDYSKKIGIESFISKSKGLSEEAIEFLNSNKKYKGWTICHADLPYITKYYAKNWINECMNNEILICESKDSGTPLIGGKNYIESFHYGENSYKKHTEMLNNENINYKKVFHKELSFEVDDLEDYKQLVKNQPRWLRKISNTSSPDRI